MAIKKILSNISVLLKAVYQDVFLIKENNIDYTELSVSLSIVRISIDLLLRLVMLLSLAVGWIGLKEFIILFLALFGYLYYDRYSYIKEHFLLSTSKVMQYVSTLPPLRFSFRGLKPYRIMYVVLGILLVITAMYKISPVTWWGASLFFMSGGIVFYFTAIIPSIVATPADTEILGIRVIRYTSRQPNGSFFGETYIQDRTASYRQGIRQVEELLGINLLIGPEDDHDPKIIRLESNLKEMNSRVDSFMLESIFMGALTFSGFISIISSSARPDMQLFFKTVATKFSTWNESQHAKGIFTEGIEIIFAEGNLFPLLLIESLLCSSFYIMILGMRNIYSNHALKLDYLSKIMNVFHAKEQELHHLEITEGKVSNRISERRMMLNEKVAAAIDDADQLANEMQYSLTVMGSFRRVGLLLFFGILITAGFFLSYVISIIIFCFFLLLCLYKLYVGDESSLRLEKLKRRH